MTAEFLSRTDVVAAFRSDLKLGTPIKGAGEDLIEVTDPRTGTTKTFRGFELSIARMLNGQRTAGAVVDAAGAIGLPISLEGLTRFVKQLRALGFLASPLDPLVQSPTTWGQRREWDQQTRARYQVALKEARRDELSAAKQHLDELRLDDPDNTDVRVLHAWVDERLQTPSDGEALPAFADIFNAVERSWFEEGERESEQNEQPVADPPEDAEDPVGESTARRRVPWKWLAALVVVVGIGLAALVPLPNATKGTFELSARNTANVTVTRPGVIGTVAVTEGQWVESGATVFLYDTQSAKQKLADAELQVSALQNQLAELASQADKPNQEVDAAHADLSAAQGELEKAKQDGKRRAIAKAKKKVKQAETRARLVEIAAAKLRPSVDAAIGPSKDELQAKLDQAISERDAQKVLSEVAPVTAPAAGFVAGLKVKPGDQVQGGTPVCRLDDTKVLVVNMRVGKGDSMIERQTASLTIDGKDLTVKIDKIENGEGRGVLDNARGTLKAGTKGELSIDAGTQSLLGRWF
ncbi:MAG: hypothetical protein JWO36_7387 [Myxococcales bacterium]|nr:hypothetical protein [Myxococcales bacterium]